MSFDVPARNQEPPRCLLHHPATLMEQGLYGVCAWCQLAEARAEVEGSAEQQEWDKFVEWMLGSPHNRNDETMEALLRALVSSRKAATPPSEAGEGEMKG